MLVAVPVTLIAAVPAMAATVAEMVVEPGAKPVATPWLPTVLLMVARLGFDEVQVAEFVRFFVLPSLYVPVAENCCVPPTRTFAVAGVTAIDVNTGGTTARLAEAIWALSAAVIVAVPTPVDVAMPCVPRELLIVATARLDELQLTEPVTFCVLPLL